jgi:acyl-CoA synthetase (NDP forming)
MGFAGPVWPVHPRRRQMGGLPCLPTVQDLPAAPDAVFVGVNRHETIGVVRALSGMGAGGAVCFASGFSEAAGEDAQGMSMERDLLAAAGPMPLLGPNCYGLINYLDGALLWPDQHGGLRQDRGVAILTQSSNIAINMTMHRRALPIAYAVTAGNQAQTGLAEIGVALLEDTRVSALGLHIEGFDRLRDWEHLANRARELGKPMVALKVGRSEQARAAMVSHTNSLAGADAGAQALLDRLGMARIDSVPALLESLKLLHYQGPLPGRRIASISCSGGEAALMADSVCGRQLTYPALTGPQKSTLRQTLGEQVALANPLDYHTYIWGDRHRMRDTFAAVMRGDTDLTLAVLDFPREDRCDVSAWQPAVDALIDARVETGGRLAVLATLPENLPEPVAEAFAARGVTPLMGIDEGLAATEAAARCGQFLSSPRPQELLLAEPTPGHLDILVGQAAQRMLTAYGLTAPAGGMVRTPGAAAVLAREIGFPVVLKGLGVAHKTEAGAVCLGLVDATEVAQAAARMAPGVSGFTVESMVRDGVAELLIGVVRDPVHGFVLTLAAGGILTELLCDSVSRLLPATEDDIAAELECLRIVRLIHGYRGRPGADLGAIVAAVQSVCAFVSAHADRVEEVEINPLICRSHDAIMADALIRIRETLHD